MEPCNGRAPIDPCVPRQDEDNPSPLGDRFPRGRVRAKKGCHERGKQKRGLAFITRHHTSTGFGEPKQNDDANDDINSLNLSVYEAATHHRSNPDDEEDEDSVHSPKVTLGLFGKRVAL